MKGKRVKDGRLPVNPGEYSLIDGVWWIKPPEKGFPSSRLTQHEVTVHSDGSISVSPSILMEAGPDRTWHGYLEYGFWRKV